MKVQITGKWAKLGSKMAKRPSVINAAIPRQKNESLRKHANKLESCGLMRILNSAS